jgi:pyridoxine kinase
MGVETAILPTAVLSTHTGGFTGYTFNDLTEDIPKIEAHWKSFGLSFDAICTGYLGSFKQIDYVKHFIASFRGDSTAVLVDPAMGDNGKLYTGFTSEFAKKMLTLCADADYILPNLTEASFMLDEEYIEDGRDRAYISRIEHKLADAGAKHVVLTGVGYEKDKLGAVCYSREDDSCIEYFTDRLPEKYHGTGDIFTSVFAGALTKGRTAAEALKIAAEYTALCIRKTIPYPEIKYGVRFEDCIPELVNMLK